MSVENPNQPPRHPWEEKLHQAGSRLDDDLRKVIRYLNDEVVPDVRRSGSQALRAAADELHRLARKMDDQPPASPPKPPADVPRP